MSKKIISLLLVVMMVASVMAMSVVSGNAASSTWYVRGTFNNWSRNDAYKMTAVGDGIFELEGVSIEAGQGFKVENGELNEWEVAYPSSDYVVSDAGTYTIRFDSNTNTVSVGGVAPSYYLIGTMNNWAANDATYKLQKNESSSAEEYFIKEVELKTDSQFKVYCNGSYLPDGWGNNYGQNGEITEDGIYDIYFRPNSDGGDGWFYNCIYVEKSTKIKGYSLSLKDEIAVNFFAAIPSAYSDITATYTYGDETANYTISGTAEINTTIDEEAAAAGANTEFICMVNARSMADTVKLSVKSGETEILTAEYAIVKYAKTLATLKPAYKDVTCAMLAYGGAVQKYFDYNTADYADSYIAEIDSDWTVNAPASLESTSTVKAATFDGLIYKGASLLTTGKTAIRLYFTGDVTGKAATYDWVESTDMAGAHYIEIPAISAKDIFSDYTITVDGVEFVYNAADYYNFAQTYSNAKLGTLLKAMYVYSQAAASIANA